MALYDRLLGKDDAGASVDNRVPVHAFQSVISEWARGRITGPQANAIIEHVSGAPLTVPEQTEAQALVASIPVGTTAANKADRAMRLFEIDQILLLADSAAPGYATPTEVKTKLGV
jgi:hypothetical protein